VVIEFAARDIVDASDLPHTVGLLKPGQEVEVEVIREGHRKRLQVTVGKRPGDGESAASDSGADRLGIEAAEIDERVRENWRLPGGVQVTEVYPESPADQAGLRPGDIIVQLGYNPINDLSDYDRVVEDLPADTPIALRFFRRGRSVFSTIELQ